MSNDIYKAPEADLSADKPGELSSEFFVVSIRKLWIMNMITMGTYSLVWNYENWKEHRSYIDNQNIWPVPRAIFSIFFISGLLNLISTSYEEKTEDKWSPVPHIIVYIVLGILGYAFSFIPDEEAILIAAGILLTTTAITYVLTLVQVKANTACSDSNGERNTKLTGWNIFWIVIFSIYWLLMLLGSYFIIMGIE